MAIKGVNEGRSGDGDLRSGPLTNKESDTNSDSNRELIEEQDCSE